MFRRLFELTILPPASVLVLWLIGTALKKRRPRLGRNLQVAAIAWLWIASTPFFAGVLLRSLQSYPPLPAKGPLPQADAIVVLSAESDRAGVEYGAAVIGPMTMQRLRYAAFLQRRTGLPLLVSGGLPVLDTPTLAQMMKRCAEQEFGVPVRWTEDHSGDTSQNADYSAELLKKDGVRTVLLVTSAWHMPRSADCFRRAGLEVVAAPTGFRGEPFDSWTSLFPHWNGMRDTSLAMHEWGGRLVYLLRDGW
ncbi:MAG: YdcF family protein [Planctomycetes bacterium]|nr:YdcF family protein [Planctomycetota bacterium]